MAPPSASWTKRHRTLFYFAARGIDAVTAENILTREKLSRLAESVGRDDMKLLAQNAIEEVL